MIGFIDEILDVAYLGRNNTHLAVATNTPDIKLYDLSTMSCQILCGHANIVLSLASTPANYNILLSSDKVRVFTLCFRILNTNFSLIYENYFRTAVSDYG